MQSTSKDPNVDWMDQSRVVKRTRKEEEEEEKENAIALEHKYMGFTDFKLNSTEPSISDKREKNQVLKKPPSSGHPLQYQKIKHILNMTQKYKRRIYTI